MLVMVLPIITVFNDKPKNTQQVYIKRALLTCRRTNRQHSESEKRNCIAWSGAESNITDSAADVLVIFDCCEAAGIGGKKVRSSRASFEFIAACGETERTKRPGKTSFTSALMWSLEKLRNEAPFTSITLVDTIKTYKHLLKTQHPELLRRDKFADNLVWIAPLISGPQPEAIAKSEHRNPRHEYIDLRFNFYRRVEPHDAENLAKHLSRLVNNEEAFAAKHISLLDISSTFSKAITVWRKSSTSSKRKSISTTSTYSKVGMSDQQDGMFEVRSDLCVLLTFRQLLHRQLSDNAANHSAP
jgi:hypothetical protein